MLAMILSPYFSFRRNVFTAYENRWIMRDFRFMWSRSPSLLVFFFGDFFHRINHNVDRNPYYNRINSFQLNDCQTLYLEKWNVILTIHTICYANQHRLHESKTDKKAMIVTSSFNRRPINTSIPKCASGQTKTNQFYYTSWKKTHLFVNKTHWLICSSVFFFGEMLGQRLRLHCNHY